MTLNEILQKINNFNIDIADEDYDFDVSEFFDDLGDSLQDLATYTTVEKEQLIIALFDFQKRQASEMQENWSFIHLIEAIDKPDYPIYDKYLVAYNTKSASITSVTLINRFINALSGEAWKSKVDLHKKISEASSSNELVKTEAKSFYDYQMNMLFMNKSNKLN